ISFSCPFVPCSLFFLTPPPTSVLSTLSLHDALPISTLYPRLFPLIRYELGDIIVNTKKSGLSVYEFEEIKGRDNDFLKIDDKTRSEEHTSELQSRFDLVCRLLLEKKKTKNKKNKVA